MRVIQSKFTLTTPKKNSKGEGRGSPFDKYVCENRNWIVLLKNRLLVLRKIIDINFLDTTVYNGKRFETKQNLDFISDIKPKILFNIWISVFGAHNPSVFK